MLPRAAAFPGSQLSMKFLLGMAFRTAADSSPVAVLQAISFSSSRIRLLLAQVSAARAQLVVDGGAVGRLIVQPPEVEAADAIGLELLGQFDTVFQQLILLLEIEAGMELVALWTLFGKRRSGPVDFEERAGYVGHAQLIFF